METSRILLLVLLVTATCLIVGTWAQLKMMVSGLISVLRRD
ncbi:hypothetical protein [Pseudomonas veronii]|nr:hypothetical protein [Pseudomonas veronii]